MPQNLHELVDLAAWAAERGIAVNPLAVLGPAHASPALLPRAELAERRRGLASQVAAAGDRLGANAEALARVLEQLQGWSGHGRAGEAGAWQAHVPNIMQFRRQGTGPLDDASARDRLERWSGAPVHRVVVGTDERARSWPPALLDVLGARGARLEGAPMRALLEVVDAYEVLDQGEDGFVAALRVGDREGRMELVPMRDEDGRCDEVWALFTFAPAARAVTAPAG
jgi:hypothetical protein